MSDLRWWVEHGDAVEALKALPDGSVDALVTDPPAGISFMGKEWDSSKGGRDKWVAWLAGILTECRRVMKPGTYGWVWALPRTAHWTATACEDAGFVVRDVLVHVFGTGFPKSRSLLKPGSEHWILIKAPGDLRELRIEENRITGVPDKPGGKIRATRHYDAHENVEGYALTYAPEPPLGRWPTNFALSHSDECEPAGTRKVKTGVAVMANRDGGVHNRVYGDFKRQPGTDVTYGDADGTETVEAWQCVGGCPVKMLDEQSGERRSAGNYPTTYSTSSGYGGNIGKVQGKLYADSGGASRFFYQAKPSTRERSQGLPNGARNTHTTVKSISLMRHLVSLAAAPSSLVLDPFTGSGSTGIAALAEGCRFVGIEREAEYVEIARQRISAEAVKIP